jgi:glycosyltransferase involved in cell wall biosynthesis
MKRRGFRKPSSGCRQVLSDFPFSSEILVIDDGSTDGTGQKAEQAGVR